MALAHNAAHHAPARKIAFDDIPRVAGRVHALVRPRCQAGMTRSAPPSLFATGAATRGTQPRLARQTQPIPLARLGPKSFSSRLRDQAA
jgi:hypothetical protein